MLWKTLTGIGRAELMVGIVLLTMTPIVAGAHGPDHAPRSVTVTGNGVATARPDIAHLTAGVVTQDTSAGAALTANNSAMERVLAAVRALGVRAEDIRTVGLRVTPQYREVKGKRPEISGYEVENRVSVTMRDVSLVGRALDRIVAEGANTIGGIAFEVGDPARVLDQARERAVADARRAAEAMARTAGVKLGQVLRIAEAQQPVPPLRAMAAAVPVEPGEEQIRVSVTVTFAIE